MKSLRLRLALWFAASVAAVMAVFMAVTFTHLRHELRVERWERVPAGRQNWALHGSYTESEVADIVGELWFLSSLYAAPVLVLAMGVGYLVARRAFVPVVEMSNQLRSIGARSLHQRLDIDHAPRELQEIGDGINALLVRLETSFGQLSEFSAQVAHELRTPLTLMRLQIEESADKINPALAESMQDELKRLSDYVEQCLQLATAEQGRLTVHPGLFRLDELVRDVVEAYSLLAREESREIQLDTAELVVESDPRLVRQLLHIALSNALRHGVGPIQVAVRPGPGQVHCTVANGIGPRRPGTAGSGLGLRLGKALATALGAGWKTGADAEGGYVVDLSFRAASPTSPPLG